VRAFGCAGAPVSKRWARVTLKVGAAPTPARTHGRIAPNPSPKRKLRLTPGTRRYTPEWFEEGEGTMARKDLQVVISRRQETVTVALAGEAHFDFAASDEHIQKVLAHKPKKVLVDAGELTFISSVGMCFLINLRRAVREAGGNVKLRGLQPRVRKVMEQAQVIGLFEVE